MADETRRQIINEILTELDRAERLWPFWPDDLLHGCAIVCEESGEAIRACLHIKYERGTVADYRKELIQTAAMAIRAIINLDRG